MSDDKKLRYIPLVRFSSETGKWTVIEPQDQVEVEVVYTDFRTGAEMTVRELHTPHAPNLDRVVGTNTDRVHPKTPLKVAAKRKSISALSRRAGPRTIAQANSALELLGDLVPKRINTEEIGDAIERIQQMAAKGRPKWRIYLKVVTTFWWVFLNTLLHYAHEVASIVKVAIGKGDSKE